MAHSRPSSASKTRWYQDDPRVEAKGAPRLSSSCPRAAHRRMQLCSPDTAGRGQYPCSIFATARIVRIVGEGRAVYWGRRNSARFRTAMGQRQERTAVRCLSTIRGLGESARLCFLHPLPNCKAGERRRSDSPTGVGLQRVTIAEKDCRYVSSHPCPCGGDQR